MARSREADSSGELDLTVEEPEAAQQFAGRRSDDIVVVAGGENFRANLQETIRSTVTWIVLVLYAVIEWRMFNAVRSEITLENIDKAAAVLMTPLVGVVGTVLGFYFGNRPESRRR